MGRRENARLEDALVQDVLVGIAVAVPRPDVPAPALTILPRAPDLSQTRPGVRGLLNLLRRAHRLQGHHIVVPYRQRKVRASRH